jgi:hypothetical protein
LPPFRVEDVNLKTDRAAPSTVSVPVLETPPNVAEMVATTVLETAFVVTVNAMDDLPFKTFAFAGTIAFALFEVSVTTVPFWPACPTRFTVPCGLAPPITAVGETEIELNVAGVRVTVACKVTGPFVAVNITGVFAETPTELIGKANAVAPAGTVTIEGRLTSLLLLLMSTLEPPGLAAPLRYTATFVPVPPMREAEVSLKTESAAGSKVRVAVEEWRLKVAVMVTTVADETATVLTANVAEEWPDVTLTEPGTVTSELLDLRLTSVPANPVATFRSTSPVDFAPPITAAGVSFTFWRATGATVRVVTKVKLL